jgi:epoxide hydrolase-like predicted phosphatase
VMFSYWSYNTPLLAAACSNMSIYISLLQVLFDRMAVVLTAPRTAMLRALGLLRSAGYLVVACTNNWKSAMSDERDIYMSRFFDPHFDFIFESCVLGMRKPDPSIFRHILTDLNGANSWRVGGAPLTPNQCVFLDDLKVNLRAAASLGIDTIHVPTDYSSRVVEVDATASAAAGQRQILDTSPFPIALLQLSQLLGGIDVGLTATQITTVVSRVNAKL